MWAIKNILQAGYYDCFLYLGPQTCVLIELLAHLTGFGKITTDVVGCQIHSYFIAGR